jgi:hypothetical protein
MNWVLFLPPLLSIYLILISNFSKKYIANQIAQFVDSAQKRNSSSETVETAIPRPIPATETLRYWRDLITNITIDWSARLSFFNSMFAAWVSSFSIWSKTGSFGWSVLTGVLLLLIFIPMMWWIMGHKPGELVDTKHSRRLFGEVPNAKICSYILIVVNLILIGAIAVSQLIIKPTNAIGNPATQTTSKSGVN